MNKKVFMLNFVILNFKATCKMYLLFNMQVGNQ